MDSTSNPVPPQRPRSAQVFGRSANTMARASIVSGIGLIIAIVVIGANLSQSSYVRGTNVVVNQPVPFSHKQHVSGLGIGCQVCHGLATTSNTAGMPATRTCMACHSQIWTDSSMLAPVLDSFRTGQPIQWNRVYDLPDFVYFNHSIHVNKGVGCTTCHGQIGQMPLTRLAQPLQMQWCVTCHAQPGNFVRPVDQVFNPNYQPPANQAALGQQLIKDYKIADSKRLTSCYVCHR